MLEVSAVSNGRLPSSGSGFKGMPSRVGRAVPGSGVMLLFGVGAAAARRHMSPDAFARVTDEPTGGLPAMVP